MGFRLFSRSERFVISGLIRVKHRNKDRGEEKGEKEGRHRNKTWPSRTKFATVFRSGPHFPFQDKVSETGEMKSGYVLTLDLGNMGVFGQRPNWPETFSANRLQANYLTQVRPHAPSTRARGICLITMRERRDTLYIVARCWLSRVRFTA